MITRTGARPDAAAAAVLTTLAPSLDPPLDWFGTPAYLTRWCALFAAELATEAWHWHDGAEAVGTALLSMREERRGPVPIRRAWLNVPPEAGFLAEHQTLAVRPTHRDAVAASLVAEARRRGWDELHLWGFDTVSTDAVARAAGEGARIEGYLSASPYIDLRALRTAGTDYVASRGASLRQRLRRSLRAYAGLQLEVPDDLPAALTELTALHARAWEARGERGAFVQPGLRRWLDAVLPTAADAGLRCLRVRDEAGTVAVLLYALHGRRVLFLQSGLRYDADPNRRPGLVAHALAADWFAAQDMDEYDFLGGERDVPRYKQELADAQRPLGFCVLVLPTPRSRLVQGLKRLRDLVRRHPAAE